MAQNGQQRLLSPTTLLEMRHEHYLVAAADLEEVASNHRVACMYQTTSPWPAVQVLVWGSSGASISRGLTVAAQARNTSRLRCGLRLKKFAGEWRLPSAATPGSPHRRCMAWTVLQCPATLSTFWFGLANAVQIHVDLPVGISPFEAHPAKEPNASSGYGRSPQSCNIVQAILRFRPAESSTYDGERFLRWTRKVHLFRVRTVVAVPVQPTIGFVHPLSSVPIPMSGGSCSFSLLDRFNASPTPHRK